jgi:hypothetical protein
MYWGSRNRLDYEHILLRKKKQHLLKLYGCFAGYGLCTALLLFSCLAIYYAGPELIMDDASLALYLAVAVLCVSPFVQVSGLTIACYAIRFPAGVLSSSTAFAYAGMCASMCVCVREYTHVGECMCGT